MKIQERLMLITSCLAFGGLGMAVIMCFLIGFGLNTVVGKEAIYTAFALQGLNLLTLHRQGREKSRATGVFLWIWVCGAVLLLTALVLGLFRLGFVSPWVRWPCLGGTILLPVGWLGVVTTVWWQKKAVS